MIRVAIVDDELLFRLGLKELLGLQPGFSVVGEAGDVASAQPMLASSKPDVVLLDVRLPGPSGLELVRRLRSGGSRLPVLLLSTFDDDQALLEVLRAGADGFLRKDASLAELQGAIRAVLGGQRYLRPSVTDIARQRLAQYPRTFESAERPERLTPRETEVLRLMAGGLSNREIAEVFGTGEATVKSQVSSIIAKLGVRDRIRAVLFALEKGYL